MFDGFETPQANWSKLPHQFVEALPLIRTKAELQVVLYVLRHTWGFQDDCKKITIDEFANGRKRKDGTRMDNGCGASRPSIIKGIQYAIEHGFLEVEKSGDSARVKHTYRLRSLTAEVKELNPGSKEPLPRSEKETVETNSKKDNSATSSKSRKKSNAPTPVAVKIFRANAHRFPAKSWYSDIDETVGTSATDLELWGTIVKAWVGCGWNPTNVKGMIECYKKKEIPGNKPRAAPGRNNGKTSMTQTMEWLEEM